jgi:putative ABC transport system permease protein
MRSILADARHALRILRKAPTFTAIAIVSIALGIGANTTIFTLLDQIVLRPLPVERPQELVQLQIDGSFSGDTWGDGSEMAYPMFRDIQSHNSVFAGVFARFGWSLHLNTGGTTERVNGELVSGSYFPTLHVPPALGRVIEPSEDRAQGAHPVAVLSFDYWQSRFSGDRTVLGRTITLNGHPFTIIGVAREGFTGIDVGSATQIFVPMMMKPQLTPGWNDLDSRRRRFARVFARLAPEVTPAQAESRLQPFFKSMREDELKDKWFANTSDYSRQEFRRARLSIVPVPRGHSGLREYLTQPLWTLMAIVAGVLLVACANVAGLLIARGMGRQREIAIRLAVGGSRARVAQQLVIESVVLGVLGGIAGLLAATWGTAFLLGVFLDPESVVSISASPDARILAFNFCVALAASVAFGLAPAVQATRPALAATLKEQSGSVAGGGPARLRKGLVIVQVAMSLLLLVGAGLFVRSLRNLLEQQPGFKPANVITFTVDPSLNSYSPDQIKRFAATLIERIGTLPSVTNASIAGIAILDGGSWNSTMTVEGYTAKANEPLITFNNTVMPGYFATLGIPLLRGRDFTAQDARWGPKKTDDDDAGVAIANQRFVDLYLKGKDPLGQHIGFGGNPGTKTPIEIVGVVGTSKYVGIREDAGAQLFFPLLAGNSPTTLVTYVRTAQSPASVIPLLRKSLHDIDPSLPMFQLRTMDDKVKQSLTIERLVAGLSTVLGVLATLLAVIGLYGVMAYTISRRTREIGIRLALGAQARGVAWLFVTEASRLLATGLLIGLPAVWALGRYVQSQLYGVAPLDPLTIVLAIVGLAAVASAGVLVPAARAAGISPLTALREE